jgi:hypothetical protein
MDAIKATELAEKRRQAEEKSKYLEDVRIANERRAEQ